MVLGFPQPRVMSEPSPGVFLPVLFSPLPSLHIYPPDFSAWLWAQGGGLPGQREWPYRSF